MSHAALSPKIQAALKARREAGAKAARLRWKAFMEARPALVALEEGRRLAGAARFTARYTGGNEAKAEEAFDAAQAAYEAGIAQALKEAGQTPSDFAVKAHCPRCQDHGLVEGKPCPCLLPLKSGLSGDLALGYRLPEGPRMASYDLKRFTKGLDPAWYQGSFSPREMARRFYRQAQQYIAGFSPRSKSLYLHGKPGTGKTYAAVAIAAALEERGQWVLFLHAAKFFRLQRRLAVIEQRFRPDLEALDGLRQETRALREADFIVLDDLSVSQDLDVEHTELVQLLDERERRQKPMLITGNLNPRLLQEQYDERVASRLGGRFLAYHFEGPDLRLEGAGR